MNVIKNIYTYGIEECDKKKIIRKISHNNKYKKIYVVTLPLFNDGILEIYSYNHLLQPFYKSFKNICVVGVADTKASALEIVLKLVQDAYDAGYEVDVKAYLDI